MKPLKTIWIGCGLFLMVFLYSCGGRQSERIEDSAPPEADLSEKASQWVDSVYDSMSTEERLAQMLMPAVYARTDASTLNSIFHYAGDIKVGGILLLKGNAASAALIADTLETLRDRTPRSPGFFISIDAEKGLAMRITDAPEFPWNHDIDPSADDQAFYDYGREIGREARIIGVNMVLGPVVDIDRSDLHHSGIMKHRSLGDNPGRVARLATAYSRGLESVGVASVPKHFPGHGATSADSHKELPEIRIDRRQLYNCDLAPFQEAAESGASAIMVGHIWVPALDRIKRPASFSPVIIDTLLRKVMGFDGLVMVDAVNMEGAQGFNGVDAIRAGADIIIAPADTRRELTNLLKAYQEGVLTERRVSESVRRILLHKYVKNLHSAHRREENPDNTKIKERLHEKAPEIISRLKGISR